MFGRICAAAFVCLFLGINSSHATTWNLELTQPDLGSSGPDWFGTFTTVDNGEVDSGYPFERITSIAVTVGGVTYTEAQGVGVYFPSLSSIAYTFVSAPGQTQALFLSVGLPIGTTGIWGYAICDLGCAYEGPQVGTHTANRRDVPEPGTLALLALGLGGLVWTRRSREVTLRQ